MLSAQFPVPAPQPFEPKLHMTDADFQTITLNGKLCDGEGGLGLEEFERVMREQVSLPSRSRLRGWATRVRHIPTSTTHETSWPPIRHGATDNSSQGIKECMAV